MRVFALIPLFTLTGCPVEPTDSTDPTDPTDHTDQPAPVTSVLRHVTVTLDGSPVAGATLIQGGTGQTVTTDAQGKAEVTVDLTIDGEIVLMASHPAARVFAEYIDEEPVGDLVMPLVSFDGTDNLAYVFQDPGEPDRRDTTLQCAHCHVTLNADWVDSPHRTSASNPALHDVYGGRVSAIEAATPCTNAGGTWATGPVPGGGEAMQCYVGTSVLADLDATCTAPPCAETSANTGGCADCHAPGIDGQVGSRGLLEATGHAYDYGVHCDVCHKVEAVHLDDPKPGVAGRLGIHRPSEPAITPLLGVWSPLQFGPSHDQPNPRMGMVQRDHFKTGEICAGCHELHQPSLIAGQNLDSDRWPDGTLPVHTTWTEWKASPFADKVPCNACHMPPATEALNSADYQLVREANKQGLTAGWIKPPGSVRHHSWVGPRTPSSQMLELSAAVDLDTEIVGSRLTVSAKVGNVGAGHRLPTGEPSRALVLHVSATCAGQAQPAVGGDVIPLFVGFRSRQPATGDWTTWPNAQVGDQIRVMSQDGWVAYEGYGPFGDGTLTAENAGLPRWRLRGESTVTGVDADGLVSLDSPLPEGEWAVLGTTPVPGQQAGPAAGAPGFAFARVLTDALGAQMVPHHRATDVASDNRLAPHTSFETTHVFDVACTEPEVTATLTYRAHPWWLASEKQWTNQDILVQRASQ